jgi:hypothetical protein
MIKDKLRALTSTDYEEGENAVQSRQKKMEVLTDNLLEQRQREYSQQERQDPGSRSCGSNQSTGSAPRRTKELRQVTVASSSDRE